MNSQLAVINFEENNTFIHQLQFNRDVWIGLRKERYDFAYTWVGGSDSLTYTNWGANVDLETNNVDAKCVGMNQNQGVWTVSNCEEMKHFACEYVGEPVEHKSSLFIGKGCYVSDPKHKELTGKIGFNQESCHTECAGQQYFSSKWWHVLLC
eukprot:UN06682